MMIQPDCLLTLILPVALEDQVVDALLEHPQWVQGYTISEVAGRGPAVSLHGIAEEVAGRSRRTQITTALSREDAQALLAHLAARFHRADVVWWIEPLLGFGRFA